MHDRNMFCKHNMQNVVELIRDCHANTCSMRDDERTNEYTSNDIADLLFQNQKINALIKHICCSCLINTVFVDTMTEFQIKNFTKKISRNMLQVNDTAPTAPEEETIEVTCQCCHQKRAQANVPCGHVFQCSDCKTRLRVHETNNDDSSTIQTCAVCRLPLLMTIDLFN